ncbi:hypothetical protein FC325_05430 [Escherichia coli]|nr:hypothetical protein [Escherichia coli]QLE20674.1 hypothetical protein FC325_05430 [Escherichia coli]
MRWVVSNEGWCFGTWHATAMYLSISTHSKVPGKNACYAKRANCLHVELSNLILPSNSGHAAK